MPMNLLVKICILLLALLSTWSESQAQFRFAGQTAGAEPGTQVYLSLVEDYRKINRVYVDQIIRRTNTDSLGYFEFQGNNLYPENRIYRIHMDSCTEPSETDHYLGICDDVQSVLFIANNSDSINFPTGFDEEIFCSVTSTNPKSGVFLELVEVKEEMIIEFAQYNSEANRQLNLQKWFKKWKQLGQAQNEPLAELYIYELLSDKRSPTYSHYLKEVSSDGYYDELLERLQSSYPTASFTELYRTEISADRQLASFRNPAETREHLTIYILLAVSVLLNLLLFIRWRKSIRSKNNSLQRLTSQERKIVDHILLDMSNKEIAEALFVSVSTVKTHINNLYKKLGVTDRHAIKALFKK